MSTESDPPLSTSTVTVNSQSMVSSPPAAPRLASGGISPIAGNQEEEQSMPEIGVIDDRENTKSPHQSQGSVAETERPPSAQQVQESENEQTTDSDDDDTTMEDEGGPGEPVVDFDWTDLEDRYHKAINDCEMHEAELMQEWQDLMTFFQVWATTGHKQETSRTFSRLRTRMTYVQHSEDELERSRVHYVNVVKAFESALKLLQMGSR